MPKKPSYEELEQRAKDLDKKFQDVCRIKPDRIDFIKKGTIPEQYQKIVDERTWE